eukprot:COSAG01_NODE_14898_length_1397_cov_2.691845_2_plen_81_part_00
MFEFITNFTDTFHDFVEHVTSPAVYGASTTVFIAVGPMTMGYLLPAQWVVSNACVYKRQLVLCCYCYVANYTACDVCCVR